MIFTFFLDKLHILYECELDRTEGKVGNKRIKLKILEKIIRANELSSIKHLTP